MRQLPTGTVTLVFTDIEGSTRLLHELGDAYADVLAEHRRLIRDSFARHDGVEVDTQGDAFFYAFARATDAAAAADEAQRALEAGPVRVRIGVHTGQPHVTREGYIGADVHRAARIMSAGHGGQVLVSEATRRLLDSQLRLRDLGEHRLKDLELPERIFQLGDGAFPPLKSLNNTNLPQQLEPLLGRKKELADLLQLIRRDENRVITLTGPGGIGKTRLALELGSELVGDFEHGVWFVDVSAIRDPDHVEPAIGAVLGARDGLIEHIADKILALVLDNLEQVLGAAPRLAQVLSACPELVLVATSREALRIGGEREYPLRSLAEAPAVELFRQRATAAAPDFDASYAELAELCARLDSLPLAIELAAARAKALAPAELRARFEQRLPLLSKGRRDAPERQRTLRATIDWSYDLLAPDERDAFARLAVFAGGWTLDAATAVCNVEADALESLVDKSLVRHAGGRYTMLETIREYAAERLDELDEAAQLRRRHAEWIVALGHSANMNIESEGEQQHAVLTLETDNIRAALDWAQSTGETELAIRILFALENWWVTAGPTRESLERALELIDRSANVAADLRGHLFRVAGNATTILGDEDGGVLFYERAVAEYRSAGDERGVAALLVRIGLSAQRAGDHAWARELNAEAREVLTRIELPRLDLQATMLDAVLAFAEGDQERGLDLFEQIASSSAELGFVWQQASALEALAERLYALDRVDEARSRARDALALARRIGDEEDMVYGLAMLASCAARLGDHERAGRHWGAVEARQQREPLEIWEPLRERFEPRMQPAVGERFEQGRSAGLRLTLDEAVEEALAHA